MSEKVQVSYNFGGGFLGILTLIFITLKLTGFINWSWLWVLSPIWLPLVVVLGGLVVVFGIAVIAMALYAYLQK